MQAKPLLYELLEKLKKTEWRQLKKFVRSPFVTHREDISRLYNVLAKHLYEGKDLPEKQALFVAVYEGEAYDDQKLRSLMSDLHLLVEKYLMWISMFEDNVHKNLSLAQFYRERHLPKHFGRTIEKVEQIQEKSTRHNTSYLQNLLRYQLEVSQFQSDSRRTEHLNLQEIGDTIDTLYLAQKLRHVCSQLSHQAVFQTDYDFGLLPEWIDKIELEKYLNMPAISLYYYCYRFLTEEYSQVYFRKFREQLSQHYLQFPKEEIKDLYRAAINFCIRKLNQGSVDYTREGWELYQEGLEAGYFLENDQLSRFTFDNVVGFGFRLGEYEAVEHFIFNYQEKLNPVFRDNTVSFNWARLEFSKKNYSKALSHINDSTAKDLVNQLILKTLQLKIYYETESLNLLESHLASFRLFIRRREVSDYHRQNFQNIINYTRKLISIQPYNDKERDKLRKAILEEDILAEREWLLEKLGYNNVVF